MQTQEKVYPGLVHQDGSVCDGGTDCKSEVHGPAPVRLRIVVHGHPDELVLPTMEHLEKMAMDLASALNAASQVGGNGNSATIASLKLATILTHGAHQVVCALKDSAGGDPRRIKESILPVMFHINELLERL
jgi:hypothetical protein